MPIRIPTLWTVTTKQPERLRGWFYIYILYLVYIWLLLCIVYNNIRNTDVITTARILNEKHNKNAQPPLNIYILLNHALHFIVLNNKEMFFFIFSKKKCVMNIKMNKFITEIGRTTA